MQKPTGNKSAPTSGWPVLTVMVTANARRQRQDGAGHVGADHRVPGRHEDLGFTGVDHLGDEFCGREIGH